MPDAAAKRSAVHDQLNSTTQEFSWRAFSHSHYSTDNKTPNWRPKQSTAASHKNNHHIVTYRNSSSLPKKTGIYGMKMDHDVLLPCCFCTRLHQQSLDTVQISLQRCRETLAHMIHAPHWSPYHCRHLLPLPANTACCCPRARSTAAPAQRPESTIKLLPTRPRYPVCLCRREVRGHQTLGSLPPKRALP